MRIVQTFAALVAVVLFSAGVQAASLNLYGGGHVLGSQSVASAGVSGASGGALLGAAIGSGYVGERWVTMPPPWVAAP